MEAFSVECFAFFTWSIFTRCTGRDCHAWPFCRTLTVKSLFNVAFAGAGYTASEGGLLSEENVTELFRIIEAKNTNLTKRVTHMLNFIYLLFYYMLISVSVPTDLLLYR